MLRIYRPGQRWSTWLFFHGTTGVFAGYYCNIESVHERSDHTTWSNDQVLDLWVEPDRTIERKDEDELVFAVEQGRYTRAEAEDITAVADSIEREVNAWVAPFNEGWEAFRPDAAWGMPTLGGVARVPGTFTSVRGEY